MTSSKGRSMAKGFLDVKKGAVRVQDGGWQHLTDAYLHLHPMEVLKGQGGEGCGRYFTLLSGGGKPSTPGPGGTGTKLTRQPARQGGGWPSLVPSTCSSTQRLRASHVPVRSEGAFPGTSVSGRTMLAQVFASHAAGCHFCVSTFLL